MPAEVVDTWSAKAPCKYDVEVYGGRNYRLLYPVCVLFKQISFSR